MAEEESKRTSSMMEGAEGIQVAIRMRPLNNKEADGRRVWRSVQEINSITQTTPEGEPLPDRTVGKTFFTFDKTFGEDSTTMQVYNDVVSGIISSTVSGLNGTIFAYGQTSSGKTFTMMGGGLKQPNVHGIIQMAAKDIFSQIEANPTRVFLLRVSFIEIYNEEVRDLLASSAQGTSAVLAIREDPKHGVFVNSNESVVMDLDALCSILFMGEKNRSVGSTSMNGQSSRSHTIFRITIESRNNDLLEEDAVRVSTLNLVDLAGSESVRHTGATGERKKEGGKINQSLLTLSRVIASLGQPGSTHINFRDSKLTRILQPSLSGNARIAVICCATPSELYIEETRSTLQFASRAKLVKTKPQVNEVLDDSSLIKRLQRELAEARKFGVGKEKQQQMQNLTEEAQNKARAAEERLQRLKACFLKAGILPTSFLTNKKKSRRSEEFLAVPFKPLFIQTLTPDKNGIKTNVTDSDLFRDALHVKAQKNIALQLELQQAQETISRLMQELSECHVRIVKDAEERLAIEESTAFKIAHYSMKLDAANEKIAVLEERIQRMETSKEEHKLTQQIDRLGERIERRSDSAFSIESEVANNRKRHDSIGSPSFGKKVPTFFGVEGPAIEYMTLPSASSPSFEDDGSVVYLGVRPTVTDDCSSGYASSSSSDSEDSLPKVKNYSDWTVIELRDALKALGLRTSGKKAELVNRLRNG